MSASRRCAWSRRVLVGLLLPGLAAAALVWSTTGRADRVDRIPVAVVNEDQIVTEPTTVAGGRALTASLTDPTDADPRLAWTLTDADDAAQGLRSGEYYAVLTIPEDFSAALVSTAGDQPQSGRITLQSNGAASVTVPYLSQAVVVAAADALGQQSTEGYLKNVYGGFNQIADSNQQAADSAAQLADGTAQLADGAVQLDDGTEELAGGLDALASGAEELQQGAASLSTGAEEVARGSRELTTGSADVARGAGSLARSSGTLADGGRDLARLTGEVARGAEVVGRATDRLAQGSQGLAADLRALRSQCGASGADVAFCARLDRLAVRATAVGAGSRVVDRGVDGLGRATGVVRDETRALAAGQRELARGARDLAAASDRVAAGSRRVADGAVSVAGGATELDAATGSVAGGAASSATAAGELVTGSQTLSSSAGQADSGAEQLSQGLAKGAAESPTYTDDQQTALAGTVSQPVVLSSSVEHAAHDDGWLVAAIVGLVLWLGAVAASLGVDVLGGIRHALTPVSSRRLALVQALPVLGLALAQVAAVLLALAVLGVGMVSALGFGALSVLAAVCFGLVAYTLRLGGGWVGVGVGVLLLVVQLASLGNVLPLETAPAAVQVLNGLLPLTAYVDAASQLVSGGAVASATGAVLVLAAWGTAAYLLAGGVVKRHRLQHDREPAAVMLAT